MHAITPKGIGKKVGARAIRPDWGLAEGETFTVEDFNEGLVLAEDGISLRQGTDIELNPPPTYSEERLKEYGTPAEQLERIIENGLDAEIKRVSEIKARIPK